MQKNPTTQILPVAGKMGTIPLPGLGVQGTAESRTAGSGQACVPGCLEFRKDTPAAERGTDTSVPRAGAAGAAPPGPLHPPAPAPTAGTAAGRGRAAPPGDTGPCRGSAGAVPEASPRRPHLGGHHGRRGACRDLPAPPSARPALPAPLSPPRPSAARPPPRAAAASAPARPGAARGVSERGLALALCFGSGIRARVRAHRVLQRKYCPSPLWGTAGPGRSRCAGPGVCISP